MTDWRKSLIEEAEKVIKHGWGKVLLTVTQDGKRVNIDTTFTRTNKKKMKVGGTDTE